MKIKYTPSGGRYGFGFDYFCSDCGKYLGNSIGNIILTHPSFEKKGWLFKKVIISNTCPQAGKIYKIPTHEIETIETI